MGISYSPHIVSDGLVLCLDAANPRSYPGSGNTWYDLSSNRSNGTLNGTINNYATYSNSNAGILTFDGTDDNVTISPGIVPTGNNITITAWCKVNNIQGSSLIEARDSNNVRCLNIHVPWGTPTVFWDHGQSTAMQRLTWSGINSDFTIWNLWTFTKSSSDGMRIYRNTDLKNAFSGYVSSITEVSSVRLCSYAINTTYYAASIGLFNMYNRPLSVQEIRQNFNATRGRYGI